MELISKYGHVFLKTRIGQLFNARLNFYVCWSTEVFLSYGSRPITAISLTRRHLSTHCANNIGAKRPAERTNDTNNGKKWETHFFPPFPAKLIRISVSETNMLIFHFQRHVPRLPNRHMRVKVCWKYQTNRRCCVKRRMLALRVSTSTRNEFRVTKPGNRTRFLFSRGNPLLEQRHLVLSRRPETGVHPVQR